MQRVHSVDNQDEDQSGSVGNQSRREDIPVQQIEIKVQLTGRQGEMIIYNRLIILCVNAITFHVIHFDIARILSIRYINYNKKCSNKVTLIKQSLNLSRMSCFQSLTVHLVTNIHPLIVLKFHN